MRGDGDVDVGVGRAWACVDAARTDVAHTDVAADSHMLHVNVDTGWDMAVDGATTDLKHAWSSRCITYHGCKHKHMHM